MPAVKVWPGREKRGLTLSAPFLNLLVDVQSTELQPGIIRYFSGILRSDEDLERISEESRERYKNRLTSQAF